VMVDVVPLSLGIETAGGMTTKIIDRNTRIPVRRSQNFSTAADLQTTEEIKVVQGERELVADNKILGNFTLTGIPPAPKGVPQIEVTFDIDANGIVSVSAKDKITNKEQAIRVKSDGGLSDSEVRRMVKDAEVNRATDQKKRDMVGAKNDCESVSNSIEKSLDEFKDKLPADSIAKLRKEITDLRTLMTSSEDPAQLKTAANKLAKSSFEAFGPFYENLRDRTCKHSSSRWSREVLEALPQQTLRYRVCC